MKQKTVTLFFTGMKLLKHNRMAWNHEVKIGNQWTIPVSDEQIQEAKKGLIKIVLTPFKIVPKEWLGDIVNKNVLCLASGGGQQGPILAAAGSNAKKKEYIENMEPFEFGHSLTDQIDGQIEAGFIISGFYEDKGEELLDKFTSTFIVTKAEKK